MIPSIINGILPAILQVAAAIFVLVLAQTRAVGRARTAGVVGAVLIFAGVVIPTIYGALLSRAITMQAMDSLYTLLVIESSIRVVLSGGGLLLLVRCVVLSNRMSPETSSWQGNPGGPTPYPSGYRPDPGPNPYVPQAYPDNPPSGGQVGYPGAGQPRPGQPQQQPSQGPQQPDPYS